MWSQDGTAIVSPEGRWLVGPEDLTDVDGTIWRSPVEVTDAMSSPKEPWAERLDAGPPSRESLGRLVDQDGGRDEAENGYYESSADAQFVANETAQRRFRAQLRRRLRHRRARMRSRESDDRS